MDGERVRVTIADHVATVTLTRPEKHNALDPAMFAALGQAARELRHAPGVRAVVLHGEGKSFCSGLDVASFADLDDGVDLGRPEGERANGAQRLCTDWIDLPVPVIAAVHGNCFGGGLQIALGADVRIAAPDAKLSVREVRWGLVPDMGITSTLPRLLRIDVAKELTYTGRTVSGEEAAALGLVTRTSEDPLGAAQALAREIAARSPDAVQAAKRLFDTAWNAPVDEGLVLETELQMSLIGGTNQMAAVTSGPDPDPEVFTDAL
ncbi:MAG TPA: crotonase/enoyl-CoA hydratase family protein [Baekduia sp.]|jgi:enoyl-CoA hydratase/carnithine racemase|nr:crotonase/enoyl-CoA hydratase family protein [Baekduia sp.]